MYRVLLGTSKEYGRNIKTRCIGLTSSLFKRKDLSSIKHDQTQSFFYDTLPAYCIPKVVGMESGEVIFEKVYASLLFLPKISLKDNWMKELGSEVAGGGKDSQQTQPKTNNPIVRTGRFDLSEQPFGSSVQEIENVSKVLQHRWKNRVFCFPVVCQCLSKVQIKTQTQTKT